MDPRGTIAKRRKYGRFLPHQRANVDQVPEREQLRPQERVGAPRPPRGSVSRCVRSQFLRAPRRYGTVC